jgi:hypothetical protein
MLSLLLLLAGPAQAQDSTTTTTVDVDLAGPPRGFGLGLVVGEPTGLTLALRPGVNDAVQAHASWSILDDRFRVSADYLRSLAVVRAEGWEVPFYLGLGAVTAFSEDTVALGGRIPLGFAVHPGDLPIEPFLEVAPGLYVFPETEPLIEGAIGIRYYF